MVWLVTLVAVMSDFAIVIQVFETVQWLFASFSGLMSSCESRLEGNHACFSLAAPSNIRRQQYQPRLPEDDRQILDDIVERQQPDWGEMHFAAMHGPVL
jgi:hypothetical protein